jgi:hypothetical protein
VATWISSSNKSRFNNHFANGWSKTFNDDNTRTNWPSKGRN